MFLITLYITLAAAETSCLLDQCEPEMVLPTSSQTSVLNQPLMSCSQNPTTGYFRDGFCHTNDQDRGVHVVCAELTADFLAYTKAQGNDLSTPKPHYGFPGLNAGDHWCLCAARWQQAHLAGVAPKVVLESTHQKTLHTVKLSVLQQYATTPAK